MYIFKVDASGLVASLQSTGSYHVSLTREDLLDVLTPISHVVYEVNEKFLNGYSKSLKWFAQN